MRILLFIVAVSFSCIANSQELFPLLDPQPECTVYGKAVDFHTAPSSVFAKGGLLLAFAWNNGKGETSVYVDNINFFSPKVTNEWREFILYHECGHHVLGHVAKTRNASYQGDKRNWELKADCYAIKRLKDDGYTQTQLNTVLRQASDMNLVASLSPLARFGPITIDKAEFDKRNKNLKQCIGNIK